MIPKVQHKGSGFCIRKYGGQRSFNIYDFNIGVQAKHDCLYMRSAFPSVGCFFFFATSVLIKRDMHDRGSRRR
jgi:hypothetical protein